MSALSKMLNKSWSYLVRRPFLILLGSLFIFGISLFILREIRSHEERLTNLPHDLLASEGEVRAHFDGAIKFLYLLAEEYSSEGFSRNTFEMRASAYIYSHPEILGISWIDPEFVYRSVAPLDSSRQLIGTKISAHDVDEAALDAKEYSRAAFSKPYTSIHGEQVLSVFVPVLKQGRFQGAFSAMYSLDGIVNRTIPPWIRERYEVSLGGLDGKKVYARTSSNKRLKTSVGINGQSDLTNQGLFLRLRAVDEGPDWQFIIFSALALGLVVGVAVAIAEMALDLRRKKIFAQELEKEKSHAEAASEAKSRFVANISHEIRTPIGAVVGYADLLLRSGTTRSEMVEGLQAIRRNGQNLLQLVNDLLDLSKIEAGLLELDLRSVSLQEILEESLLAVFPQARSKGLNIVARASKSMPVSIMTDSLRLKQILVNVLGNAVKFSEEGSIFVECSIVQKPGARQNPRLELTVTDNGVGMTREQAARLFQSFSQGDRSVTRRFGGTGLGLSVARKLSRLLGGDLVLVRTEPGSGSTFRVTIDVGNLQGVEFGELKVSLMTPAKPLPVADAHKAGGVRLSDVNILLVEDEIDNQIIISEYLGSEGANVEVAGDGFEALERLSTRKYDLVLMDIQMPGMDGYETTKCLRKRGFSLPVVALTAYAMRGERERCLAAGCNEYLTKPLDVSHFMATVERYVRVKPTSNKPMMSHLPSAAPISRSNLTLASAAAAYSEVPEEIENGPLVSTLWSDPRVRAVLGGFLERLPVRMTKLQESLDKEDWKSLGDLAHSLKGTAGNFGYPGMVRLAMAIEEQIDGERDMQKVANDVVALRELTERARAGFVEQ